MATPRGSNAKTTTSGAVAEDTIDVPLEQLAGPDSLAQEVPGSPEADVDGDFVAVVDVVSWKVPIEGTVPPKFGTRRRFLGQFISGLPAGERDRLLELGAIAAKGDPARQALAAKADGGRPTVPQGEVGDNELSGWDQPNLVAYVTQFPTEADRVNRIERSRAGGPRASVVRAAGYDPETGDRLE